MGFYVVCLVSSPFGSIRLCSSLLYTILLCSTLFYSILLYSFYSLLLCLILFYSILSYPILISSTGFDSTHFNVIRLNSAPLHSIHPPSAQIVSIQL